MDKIIRNTKELFSSRWLPWVITGFTLLVVVLYEVLLPILTRDFSRFSQSEFWILTLAGLGLMYLTASHLSVLIAERRRLENSLVDAERRVGDAYHRLEAIFRVSQTFVEANDENEVIEPVLRLLSSLVGASGATFVPIDEHGQPQAVASLGELPFPMQAAWLEYLASPRVRERCASCESEFTDKPAACPLLKTQLAGLAGQAPFSDAIGLFCVPVRRGEREYGMLNLFLDDEHKPDEQTRIYLHALVDEMALGLEGIYLRRRELSALRQVQVLRKQTDLSALLNGLLENVYNTLDADFAVMVVPRSGEYQAKIDLAFGELPANLRPFVDGILQGVMASGEPLLLGDVSGDPESGKTARSVIRSLMAAPLFSTERSVLGVLMVGNRRVHSFHQRQLSLLQTIAGQVALVVQNANLMAELEFQSMIQERARLAREIHDGLAQTIGFLKLQAAQLRGYLAHGEVERASQSAEKFFLILSEAYQDARQAIDGLRISPDGCGVSGWLVQMTREFSELSDLPVELEMEQVQIVIKSEVQAQLIRILQETLSNVRKHASASRVWVACHETAGDLVLEVRDDGRGFSPEDVVSASRHGLRGMRERADLIGADFQIISRPEEGTIVRLRLPVQNLEETIQ